MNANVTAILKAIRDSISTTVVTGLADILARATSIDNKLDEPIPTQADFGYVVPYVASTADLVTLVGAPCDGVQVPTDDYSIAFAGAFDADTYPGQSVSGAPTSVGAGWVDNGDGTYTHTGGGGVAPLEWSGRLTEGARVLSKYTVTGQTAGTITAAAGTAAGAATAADAAVRELLLTAGNQVFSFTPTDPFDGTISLVEVLPVSPPMKAGSMAPIRCRRIEAVIDEMGAESPASVLFLGWHQT